MFLAQIFGREGFGFSGERPLPSAYFEGLTMQEESSIEQALKKYNGIPDGLGSWEFARIKDEGITVRRFNLKMPESRTVQSIDQVVEYLRVYHNHL